MAELNLTVQQRAVVENRGGSLSVTVSGEEGVITSLLLEGPTEITAVYQR